MRDITELSNTEFGVRYVKVLVIIAPGGQTSPRVQRPKDGAPSLCTKFGFDKLKRA